MIRWFWQSNGSDWSDCGYGHFARIRTSEIRRDSVSGLTCELIGPVVLRQYDSHNFISLLNWSERPQVLSRTEDSIFFTELLQNEKNQLTRLSLTLRFGMADAVD